MFVNAERSLPSKYAVEIISGTLRTRLGVKLAL